MTMQPDLPSALATSDTPIRVALFLINRQFIRSWIESGLIERLEESGEFEFTIFAQTDVYQKLPDYITDKSISLGEIIPSRFSKHMVAMGMIEFASKSPTFKFKLERLFLPETWIIPKQINFPEKVKWLIRSTKRILGNTLQNRWTIGYLIPPFRWILKFMLTRFSKITPLPKQLDSKDFDWLIMPTASAHGLTTDFIRSAKLRGISTIVAIDNWDQLTGKSNFPIKPNFFTVMGKQCVEHAIKIHECNPETILPFGLPRFDIYRTLTHSCNNSAKTKKTILYCGVALAHSEKFVVDQIARDFQYEIENNEIEIVYRPHPGPLKRFDDYEIMNPNVRIVSFGDISRTAMPEMDQGFLDAILDSDVIVGAPTTLILESLFCHKKVVLDLTTDNFHRTTAGNSAVRHTHIRDLTNIETIPRGNSLSELIMKLRAVLNDPNDCSHHRTSHLFDHKGPLYSDQLATFLRSETSLAKATKFTS